MLNSKILDDLGRQEKALGAAMTDKMEEASRLQGEIASMRRTLDAIRALRAVAAESPDTSGDIGSVQFDVPPISYLPSRRRRRVTQYSVIADAAYQSLAEARRPMHFTEITERLLAQGLEVGGRDPNNGVIAAMVRDKRFYRTARGTYYLRDLAGGPVKNVGERHRKGA